MTLVYWVGPLPTACDLCGAQLKDAFIDGKTQRGPWAIMCGACHARAGQGVGTGRGQLYTVQPGGRFLKVQ